MSIEWWVANVRNFYRQTDTKVRAKGRIQLTHAAEMRCPAERSCYGHYDPTTGIQRRVHALAQ